MNHAVGMVVKYLCVLLALLSGVSCTSDGPGFRLDGTITGAAEGEVIRLSYPVSRQGIWYLQTDSARVVGGRFRFEGEVPGIVPAWLSFDNMDEAPLFLEPSQIRLCMERERPYAGTLRGLSVGKEFDEYRNWLGEVPQRLFEKQRQAQELNQQWIAAVPGTQDSLWSSFLEAVQSYKRELAVEDSLRMVYVEAHPERTISPHLLYLSIRTDWHEPEPLHALYDRIPQTTANRILRELADIQLSLAPGQTGVEVGQQAGDFERHESAGGSVRLSDYAGQSVVLLDFWASWCGPCLKAAPAIRELTRKYADKGLQVIGVSVDDDSTAWQRALLTHGLTYYPQVLSCELADGETLYFPEQADLADRYRVTQIPCLILIDREGRIAARWTQITSAEESTIEKTLH